MLSATFDHDAAAYSNTALVKEHRSAAAQAVRDDLRQGGDDCEIETILDEIFSGPQQGGLGTGDELLLFAKNVMGTPVHTSNSSVSAIDADKDAYKHGPTGNGAPSSSVPIAMNDTQAPRLPQIMESKNEERTGPQQAKNRAALSPQLMFLANPALGTIQSPKPEAQAVSWAQMNGIFSHQQPVPLPMKQGVTTTPNMGATIAWGATPNLSEEQVSRRPSPNDDATQAVESQHQEPFRVPARSTMGVAKRWHYGMIAGTVATGQIGGRIPGRGFSSLDRMEHQPSGNPRFPLHHGISTTANHTVQKQGEQTKSTNPLIQKVKNKGGRPRKNISLAEKRKRNRENAKKSRLRKKSFTDVLRESEQELKAENQLLRLELHHALGKAKADRLVAEARRKKIQQADDFLTTLLNRRSSQRVLDDDSIKFLRSLGRKKTTGMPSCATTRTTLPKKNEPSSTPGNATT